MEFLNDLLKNYKNLNDAKLLLNGFKFGFRLQYKGPRISRISKNLLSAETNKEETKQKLLKEVQLGKMLGPFSQKPISNLQTSPIGLVPKKDLSLRLITHLSFPKCSSINDFIDPEICKVKYSSIDKVLETILSCGRSAKLGKIDISQAFRLIVINPADFDLLGIMFDGEYFIDKCLPFGCSLSCALFEKFATMLHWAVTSYSGINTLDHYLDDFIFIGPSSSDHCYILMNTFLDISNQLGVPINDSKTVWPTTLLTFLGLDIDTVAMTIRIPEEKLVKLKNMLTPLLSMKKVTLRDLESVVGLMSFCARAITSSRAFLRRFYDLIATVNNKKPYHFARLNSEVKEDVKVWLNFLEHFNGSTYISDQTWLTNETLELFTDSSGNHQLGAGAYFAPHWVQYKWPNSWVNTPILRDMTVLELIPVVLALLIWGSELQNKKLIFRIDNSALVATLNKRTSKSKSVMKLVRPLVFLTMRYNIQFKAMHIEGLHNSIADSLSRFQMERFRSLAPMADKEPVAVPQKFLQIISELTSKD